MLAVINPVEVLSIVLTASAAVGGVGYAVGQFFSSRKRGVADSLKTALDEVEVAKIRADRLAILASEKADELAACRMEVQTLRDVLTSGAVVAPEIVKAIEAALAKATKLMHEEHEKTRAAFAAMSEERQ